MVLLSQELQKPFLKIAQAGGQTWDLLVLVSFLSLAAPSITQLLRPWKEIILTGYNNPFFIAFNNLLKSDGYLLLGALNSIIGNCCLQNWFNLEEQKSPDYLALYYYLTAFLLNHIALANQVQVRLFYFNNCFQRTKTFLLFLFFAVLQLSLLCIPFTDLGSYRTNNLHRLGQEDYY